jgi:transposase InsO family protein
MSERRPDREWWSASEIAEAGLPDLPPTRQGVEKLIKREGWRAGALARRRPGRGGGWEYHWSLFPVRARRVLLPALESGAAGAAAADRDAAWSWFETLPAPVQAKARTRLDALRQVEALMAQGETKQAAIGLVGNALAILARTLWAWFALVEGVRVDDRLAHLAPRHRQAAPRRAQAVVDAEFMALVKSDFLRPARPSLSSVWRRQARVAEDRGIPVAPEWAVRRRLEREVSRFTTVLLREGEDALRRLYPAQTRDKTALSPLEVVNADFHKFDVFVEWPLERGETGKGWIGRPQMVAFQDVFSGRILSWRVDQQPNALAVQLAAGDMIERFGIPQHILLDNGREFAAKALTGGTPTRYRFKVREDDVPGLFIALGCEIHLATPYSGQSKPIERAFRDMCDAIAKDPRFDGAWTGNTPEAKPEPHRRLGPVPAPLVALKLALGALA